jgi:hypothetical protein
VGGDLDLRHRKAVRLDPAGVVLERRGPLAERDELDDPHPARLVAAHEEVRREVRAELGVGGLERPLGRMEDPGARGAQGDGAGRRAVGLLDVVTTPGATTHHVSR